MSAFPKFGTSTKFAFGMNWGTSISNMSEYLKQTSQGLQCSSGASPQQCAIVIIFWLSGVSVQLKILVELHILSKPQFTPRGLSTLKSF